MAFNLSDLNEALDCVLAKIRTKHEKCPLCGGKINLQERSIDKGELVLYSDTGSKRLLHLEYRCQEKHCRTGLFYGYNVSKGGKKIFESDCLQNDFLVVSRKTAFSIPWLYSATLKIYHFNATFDRLAAEYNDYHNFGYNLNERVEVDAQRIADGWFMYTVLELNQRWGIQPEFDGSEKEIENFILENANIYKTRFRLEWSLHQCEVKGCGEFLICDGGMKPHRVVCAARYSGFRTYRHSNVKTITGCTKKPGLKSQFCDEHQGNEGPVILAEQLSRETREKLRKRQSLNYPQVDWYEADMSRLGRDLPAPHIKWTKEAGKGEKFHFLAWGKTGTWVAEEQLIGSIFDMDLEALVPESSCNTRKEKDKRTRRHTVGLHIAAWPCGIIPDFAELYGSESITQVWAIICEFLGDMEPGAREKLQGWLYDDMCHLMPYAENAAQKEQSSMAQVFAKLKKAVDKLHFRGHRGAYCQQYCDPWKIKELEGVNTPVCEQTFSWMNGYSNCRSMNESRFFWFFLYLIDMRNLDREQKLRIALDPRNPARVHYISNSKKLVANETSKASSIKAYPESEKEEEKEESCVERYTFDNGDYKCNMCNKKYKKLGYMKTHIEKNHGLLNSVLFICKKCKKTFETQKKLTRHENSKSQCCSQI